MKVEEKRWWSGKMRKESGERKGGGESRERGVRKWGQKVWKESRERNRGEKMGRESG